MPLDLPDLRKSGSEAHPGPDSNLAQARTATGTEIHKRLKTGQK
jgi:hypothetical protein